MGKVSLKKSNAALPAPKFYRKLENVLLIVVIPAVVTVLQNWGFEDERLLNRWLLLISVLSVALIKGVGMLLANGEEYTKASKEGEGAVIPTKGP